MVRLVGRIKIFYFFKKSECDVCIWNFSDFCVQSEWKSGNLSVRNSDGFLVKIRFAHRQIYCNTAYRVEFSRDYQENLATGRQHLVLSHLSRRLHSCQLLMTVARLIKHNLKLSILCSNSSAWTRFAGAVESNCTQSQVTRKSTSMA